MDDEEQVILQNGRVVGGIRRGNQITDEERRRIEQQDREQLYMASAFGYMWDIDAYYEQFYNSSSEEFSNSIEHQRSEGSRESEGQVSSEEEERKDHDEES